MAKRKVKSSASRAAGRAWALSSKAPPKPPSASFRAKPGTGRIAGRWTAAANLRVKSRLRSAAGAQPLRGPARVSESTAWTMAARMSSTWIQGIHWRPLPSLPPMPALKIRLSFSKASPPCPSTTPVRRRTTRTPSSSASMAAAYHSQQRSAR